MYNVASEEIEGPNCNVTRLYSYYFKIVLSFEGNINAGYSYPIK